MKQLKKIFFKIRIITKKIRFLSSINWTKTLYFNFKMLPIRQAKKIPVVFYGNVKFSGLNGEVVFNTPIKRGMCGFGQNLEIISAKIGNAELKISGKLIINGSFLTGNDYNIQILKGGQFSIGEGSYLGNQTKIICTEKIKVGKSFRFGYESQMSDSNYHFTLDMEKKLVYRYKGEIDIGDFCWVGNRSSIMKGTITPNHLIVASNSLLNKNYIGIVPEYSVIGGMPAKLLKKHVVRVFDIEAEKIIKNFFLNNPEKVYLNYESVLPIKPKV